MIRPRLNLLPITAWTKKVQLQVLLLKKVATVSFNSDDPLENIQHAVEQGEKELVIELVEKALADGVDPLKITKHALSEAMNVVGEKVTAPVKSFYLQVMLAAEAMQGAFLNH